MPCLLKKQSSSTESIPVVLTIAGSDSGGGAGIQADLKTFAALGVFGTSAITCLTAQNPDEVAGIHPAPPGMVALQIQTVLRGFPVAAAKTGMLYSAAIIKAVARTLTRRRIPILVVDPVMIATSGARLLQTRAIAALQDCLLPLATVITPNLPEAEVLGGHPIRSRADQRAAAREIGERYGAACVIKGGHSGGRRIHDILFFRGACCEYTSPRISAAETHGTGCAFSAALTALLARGVDLPDAVPWAIRFVRRALCRARRIGRHFPLALTPLLRA